MKKYITTLFMLVAFALSAQINIRLNPKLAYKIANRYKTPANGIFKSISEVILEEKVALKGEIEKIDKQLESNSITNLEAETLKKEAAEKHASNIERRVNIEERKMRNALQDYTNKQISLITVDSVYVTKTYKGETSTKAFTPQQLKKHKQWIEKMNKMTFQQFIVAYGMNNVIVDNEISSLNDSDYYFFESNFFELGYTFKKRLSKEYSLFHFKYGASLLFNNLVAKDNQYQVKSGDQTNLVTHTKDLNKSRLKYIQFIVPLHLEIDFSKPSKIDDVYLYRRGESFRLGIGGYGGFKVYSRQILKYEEEGLNVKEKTTDHYNLNNFTYGLSGYFGYRSMTLYAKYDLNTLFKNSDTNGVSLGLRVEF